MVRITEIIVYLVMALTAAERDMVIAAMQAQPDAKTSPFYQAAMDHIASTSSIARGDVVFVNRPLMLSADPRAKALLDRIRAEASRE